MEALVLVFVGVSDVPVKVWEKVRSLGAESDVTEVYVPVAVDGRWGGENNDDKVAGVFHDDLTGLDGREYDPLEYDEPLPGTDTVLPCPDAGPGLPLSKTAIRWPARPGGGRSLSVAALR